MKKFLLVCCVLVAPILITSCKDNSPAPGPSHTVVGYFHLGTGSNWVYSNYEWRWDSSSTPFEQKLDGNDSLFLQDYQQVLGKDAIMMRHHFVNPLLNTTINANYAIYEDEATNKLYVSSDFMKIFVPELLQTAFPMVAFEKDWYLLADYYATKEWMLDSFELANFTPSTLFQLIPTLEVLGIKLNGHIKVGIQKMADTTILFGDAIPLKSNTYCLSMFFEGNASSTNPYTAAMLAGAGKVRVDFAQINFYLSGQAGLLGIFSPARELAIYSVTTPTISVPLSYRMEGFEKRLIHLDAKKVIVEG